MAKSQTEKLRKQLIADYTRERKFYADGVREFVPSHEVWDELVQGRLKVPKDEIVAYCEHAVSQLKAGADPDLFNY